MNASEPRPCRACGREIVFATGPNGKPIPLSRVANVYWIDGEGSAQALAEGGLYISHFVDCTDAARFSKRQRPMPHDPENVT